MRTPGRCWTEAELAHALALRETGATLAAIAAAVGRSIWAVAWKFEQLRSQGIRADVAAGPKLVVPPAVLDARAARRVAADERSLTAALMGDPPPGFSALDRRGSGGSATAVSLAHGKTRSEQGGASA